MALYRLCNVNKSIGLLQYNPQRQDISYDISNVFRHGRLYIKDSDSGYIVTEIPFRYGNHRVIALWRNTMLAGIFLDSVRSGYESIYLNLSKYSDEYAVCRDISYYYAAFEEYILLVFVFYHESKNKSVYRVVSTVLFHKGRIIEVKNKQNYYLDACFDYYLKKYVFKNTKIKVYVMDNIVKNKIYGDGYDVFSVHVVYRDVLIYRLPCVVQGQDGKSLLKSIDEICARYDRIDLLKPQNKTLYTIKMKLNDLEIKPLNYNIIIKFDTLLETMCNDSQVFISVYRIVLTSDSLSLVNIYHQKIDDRLLAKMVANSDFNPVLVMNEREKILINNAKPYFILELDSGKVNIYQEVAVLRYFEGESILSYPDNDRRKELVLVFDKNNNYKILCFSHNKEYWSVSVPSQYASQVLEIFNKGLLKFNGLLAFSQGEPAMILVNNGKDSPSNENVFNVFHISKGRITKIDNFYVYSYRHDVFSESSLYWLTKTSSDDYVVIFMDISVAFRYDYVVTAENYFWYERLHNNGAAFIHIDRYFVIYQSYYHKSFNHRKSIVIDYSVPEQPKVYDGLMLYCDDSGRGLYIIQKGCFLIEKIEGGKKHIRIIKYSYYRSIIKGTGVSGKLTHIKLYEHLLDNKRYRIVSHILIPQKSIVVRINDTIFHRYLLPADKTNV